MPYRPMPLVALALLVALAALPPLPARGTDLIVTSTSDEGPGSLRAAIEQANATAGADSIRFALVGAGPHTIRPLTSLPPITDPLTIDGTTQPGYGGAPLVALDGSAGDPGMVGLWLQAAGSIVRGLSVGGFGGAGVLVDGAGDALVEACVVGADPSGLIARPNRDGVVVRGGARGAQVRDTIVAGNTFGGVVVEGEQTTGAVITMSRIGLGADDRPLGNNIGVTLRAGSSGALVELSQIGGNAAAGVLIDGSGGNRVQFNLIGATSPGDPRPNGEGVILQGGAAQNSIGPSNRIAANIGSGVLLQGAGTSGNVVRGNRIGLSDTSLPRPNRDGVTVQGGASGNQIGGAGAQGANIIAGNSASGVLLQGAGTSGNRVLGNGVGLLLPTGVLGNRDGVTVRDGAVGTMVGAPGQGNQIVGNVVGVLIAGGETRGTVVQSNRVGTDAGGSAGLSNGLGVLIAEGAAETLIGGSGLGEGNTIAGNRGVGVLIRDGSTTGNRVEGNQIGLAGLPNSDGVTIREDAFGNTVGGTAPGAGNTIGPSLGAGVGVAGAGNGNRILGNRIFGSGGLGIDLGLDGVTQNDPGDGDAGPNDLINAPVLRQVASGGGGTAAAGWIDIGSAGPLRVEVFASMACHPAGSGEGEVYLGAADLAGPGAFSLTVPGIAPPGASVSATVTDARGSTSEFSTCARALGSTYLPLVAGR